MKNKNSPKAPTKARKTKAPLKQLKSLFEREFATGKLSAASFARKYNIRRATVQNWKTPMYGKGSQKQKLAGKMHFAGIDKQAIAEYFKVPVQQIERYIRREKDKANISRKRRTNPGHSPTTAQNA
jgi:uncharacterized protein YjcR